MIQPPGNPPRPGEAWCPECDRGGLTCSNARLHSRQWTRQPGPLYCAACGCQPAACRCPVGTRHIMPAPREPRSVVGTTLLVLLTVFVIAPLLLIVGCGALMGG